MYIMFKPILVAAGWVVFCEIQIFIDAFLSNIYFYLALCHNDYTLFLIALLSRLK